MYNGPGLQKAFELASENGAVESEPSSLHGIQSAGWHMYGRKVAGKTIRLERRAESSSVLGSKILIPSEMSPAYRLKLLFLVMITMPAPIISLIVRKASNSQSGCSAVPRTDSICASIDVAYDFTRPALADGLAVAET